jgi:hypothetical protein
MSEVRRGMEDNNDKNKASTTYDVGGPNHVRLPYNPCGCVYSMDTDSQYSLTSMTGLLCGTPKAGDPANICELEEIANPDNVGIMDNNNILIIGARRCPDACLRARAIAACV